MGINLGHWITNAARSAGRPIGSLIKDVNKVTGAIGKGVGKVPFIGHPLSAMFMIANSPFEVSADIASGKRVDKALFDSFKADVKSVREVAPWAQMVISLVPGVGSAVSGAIGAGLALASGQTITQSMVAFAKGAVPGGPLAASAFDAAVKTVSGIAKGEPAARILSEAGVAALPIPDVAKSAVSGALEMAGKVAKGENPGMAAIDAAEHEVEKALLPPEVKKALQSGIAIAHAQHLQQTSTAHIPSILPNLEDIGQQREAADPVVRAARATVVIAATDIGCGAGVIPTGALGFDVGAGLMVQQAGVHDIATVREQLTGADDKKGFDLAVSLHIGRAKEAAKPGIAPAVVAGKAMTHGMMGAPPLNKVDMMKSVASHPETAKGAAIGVNEIKAVRGGKTALIASAAGISAMAVASLAGMAVLPVIGLGVAVAGTAAMLSS